MNDGLTQAFANVTRLAPASTRFPHWGPADLDKAIQAIQAHADAIEQATGTRPALPENRVYYSANEVISAEDLSELIGVIYDSAIDPRHWPTALRLIQRQMRGHAASLVLQDIVSGKVLVGICEGISSQWYARMHEYPYESMELFGGTAHFESAMYSNEPVALSRNPASTKAICNGNRFFHEWGKPQGLLDYVCVPLALSGVVGGYVLVSRHESVGLISEREIVLAKLLLPHLRRAAVINSLLEARTIDAARAEATLDSLTLPVVLVGADMNLVHANAAAQAMLCKGDVIARRKGQLVTASFGITQALTVAVAQALQNESQLDRKGFGIPAFNNANGAYSFFVLPLNTGAVRCLLMPGAVAAVFIGRGIDPSKTAHTDMLTKLFSLTATEAQVCELIAAGHSTVETATALGIAVSTVKTHLQHLYRKTGVNRQTDLTALATSLAPSLPATAQTLPPANTSRLSRKAARG